MNKIEEKAELCEKALHIAEYGIKDAYKQGAEETLEEVCIFLKETFFDDHSDATSGISCLFPDIILTEKYFKVDDLIDGLNKYIKGDNDTN